MSAPMIVGFLASGGLLMAFVILAKVIDRR